VSATWAEPSPRTTLDVPGSVCHAAVEDAVDAVGDGPEGLVMAELGAPVMTTLGRPRRTPARSCRGERTLAAQVSNYVSGSSGGVSGSTSMGRRDQALGTGRLVLMMSTPTSDGYRGSSSPWSFGRSQPM
jgi:hypothetical protein